MQFSNVSSGREDNRTLLQLIDEAATWWQVGRVARHSMETQVAGDSTQAVLTEARKYHRDAIVELEERFEVAAFSERLRGLDPVVDRLVSSYGNVDVLRKLAATALVAASLEPSAGKRFAEVRAVEIALLSRSNVSSKHEVGAHVGMVLAAVANNLEIRLYEDIYVPPPWGDRKGPPSLAETVELLARTRERFASQPGPAPLPPRQDGSGDSDLSPPM